MISTSLWGLCETHGLADEGFETGLRADVVPVGCLGRVTMPTAEIVIAEHPAAVFDERESSLERAGVVNKRHRLVP